MMKNYLFEKEYWFRQREELKNKRCLSITVLCRIDYYLLSTSNMISYSVLPPLNQLFSLEVVV